MTNHSTEEETKDHQTSEASIDPKKQKMFGGNIRFGVSEIDANYELKKFLVQHSERRLNIKNKLSYDIKLFMEDLIKIKAGRTSKAAEMAEAAASRGKAKFKNKFIKEVPIEAIGEEEDMKVKKKILEQKMRDIE